MTLHYENSCVKVHLNQQLGWQPQAPLCVRPAKQIAPLNYKDISIFTKIITRAPQLSEPQLLCYEPSLRMCEASLSWSEAGKMKESKIHFFNENLDMALLLQRSQNMCSYVQNFGNFSWWDQATNCDTYVDYGNYQHQYWWNISLTVWMVARFFGWFFQIWVLLSRELYCTWFW